MSQFTTIGFRTGVETTGEPFVTVKPAFRMMGDNGAFADIHYYMPPAEARLLASELIQAADYASQPAVVKDLGDAVDAAQARVELLTNEE